MVEPSAVFEGGQEQAAQRAPDEQATGQRVTEEDEGEEAAEEADDEMDPEGVEYEMLLEMVLPSAPMSLVVTAVRGYTALAAAHALAGVAMMACAVAAPQLLLPEAILNGECCVLLGCLGAGALRAAALFMFLTESAMLNELCTWRHQRLNLILALGAFTAAAAQGLALLNASPLLSLIVLGLSLPTVLLCVWLFREAKEYSDGFFTWVFDWSRPLYTAQNLGACLLRDASSVSGVLLLVLLAVSAYGSLQLLLTGLLAPAMMSVAIQLDMQPWIALRQCMCSSLLLLAASAHTLLDFAPWSLRLTPLALAKAAVERELLSKDRLQAAMKPPQARFTLMNVTVLAAAVAQAAFLLQVHPWGADVNLDATLWGPVYLGTLLSLLYAAAVACTASWDHLVDACTTAMAAAMALAAWLVDKFVYPWEWQTPAQR